MRAPTVLWSKRRDSAYNRAYQLGHDVPLLVCFYTGYKESL